MDDLPSPSQVLPAGAGAQTEAPAAPPPAAGIQVRRNFLSAMRETGGPLSRFNKVMIVLLTLATLTLSASILTILIVTRGEPCDIPLVTFSAVYLIRLLLTYPLSMYQLLHPTTDARGRRRTLSPETMLHLQLVERIKSMSDLIGTIWFIIGNWWLFSSNTCSATNPPLYYISLVLVLIGYLVLLVPIILCAAVVFCLPCVLVVLRALRIGRLPTGAGGVDSEPGLTDEAISEIPVYTFRQKRTVAHSSSSSEIPSCSSSAATKKEHTEDDSHPPAPHKSSSIMSFFSRLGRRASASPPSLSSLSSPTPTLELSEEDALCVICLAGYEDGDSLRMLSCQHHFHQSCIDEWLHLHKTCPLCVQEIEPSSQPGHSVDTHRSSRDIEVVEDNVSSVSSLRQDSTVITMTPDVVADETRPRSPL